MACRHRDLAAAAALEGRGRGQGELWGRGLSWLPRKQPESREYLERGTHSKRRAPDFWTSTKRPHLEERTRVFSQAAAAAAAPHRLLLCAALLPGCQTTGDSVSRSFFFSFFFFFLNVTGNHQPRNYFWCKWMEDHQSERARETPGKPTIMRKKTVDN